MAELRRLRAFLCHSSGDKSTVRILYHRLIACNVESWLDEENLLAGQDWQYEIRKAVRAADVIIVCLSRSSIVKEGFVQKEIKLALDVADEKPEGTIFIIPFKLEECDLPLRLQSWHAINFFEEHGFEKLIKALKQRGEALGKQIIPINLVVSPDCY